MTFIIVSSIVSLLAISLILAGILQLASRVVNGQAIAYRDAFSVTFGVLLVSNLLKMFLWTPLGFDEWWVLSPVNFLMWWTALAQFLVRELQGRLTGHFERHPAGSPP